MADNSAQNATDIIATDELVTLNGGASTGVKVQRVKPGFGVDGDFRDVSAAFPMPTMTPDVTATGALAALNATQALSLNGASGAAAQIGGTWVGTITFEGTLDGVSWFPVNAVSASTSSPQTTTTANGLYRLTPGGLSSIRANMTAFTSGSAAVGLRASSGVGGTFANQILPVKTLEGGFISTANSSAAALGISGAFTGTAEDVTEYADVRVTVFADQASAVDGLQIQQSSNGTNWDVTDVYSIPAATGKVFSVGVSSKFYRIVYTNGTTAQAAFRLQVKLGKVHSRPSSVRPQDGRTNDNDMDEVIGHLMGYNGAGWDRLRSSIANGLVVDVSRILTTSNVAGTRNNNGTGTVAGSFHLTTGGSDGTNLRPLSVDTTGRLNVNAILAAETTKIIGSLNANQSVNTAQISGVVPLMGNGISGTGSQRVNIASDNTAFPVNATLTAETTKVIGTVNVAAAQVIAVSQSVAANLQATVIQAATTTTAATLSSAATTNATSVKAAAGNLYSVTASNVGAAAAFLKIFNLAAAPTVGTSVPFLTVPITASGLANVNFGAHGIRMSAGISFSITNLVADADTTAIAAAQVKVAIAYI